MILTAHQPAYLPWLGLFHKIILADAFVILDNVQFEKNSFINRNRIKTPNGTMWLSIPVLMRGHTQKVISDMVINNNVDWCSDHWKAIYLNYKKAPYFHKYSDFFYELYRKEWRRLFDLLYYSMDFFIRELNINTKIYRQSDLHIDSKKQLLILDLCKHFNAEYFFFGIEGKNYADVDLFRQINIKVAFQEYRHPFYPQLWGDFISNLSIIDLLFNVGRDKSVETILSQNISSDKIIEVSK